MSAKLFFLLFLLFTALSTSAQEFHTDITYTKGAHKNIRIENSYPRGGLGYTDAQNTSYGYVVFWSRVTNDSPQDLTLNIDFLATPYSIPTASGVYFNCYIPQKEMRPDNAQSQDYGLDVKHFLDTYSGTATHFHKVICAGESAAFYTVLLSNQGVQGVIRTGFALDQEALVYKINGHPIYCGNLKAD